ncbi:MAG: hypothetical protein WC614_00430 [bacterium]
MKNHIRISLYLLILLLMVDSAVFALSTTIKSYDGHYLWAENGGGGVLQFTSLGGTTLETFTIESQVSGRVAIKCYDNTHYVWANNGGGGTVQATSFGGTTWETFTMVDLGGGKYAFKCYDGTHYLSATNGGDSTITASATNVGNYETFEWSGYTPQSRTSVSFGTRIANETFIWSTYTPGGSVTVGHSGSGSDYICDGTNDEVEINQALATKKIVKLITDSPYNITNSIIIPGSDIIYTLTANTSGNPPTLIANKDNSAIISCGDSRAFEISYLKFDGNSRPVSCIYFTNSKSGSSIHNCTFYGYNTISADKIATPTGPGILTGFLGNGVNGLGECIISVYSNEFLTGTGAPIWVEGKTTGIGNTAPTSSTVFYANVYDNYIGVNSYGYFVGAGINSKYAHIYRNICESNSFGSGIFPSRSWVEYNVIRGDGYSGICPSCWHAWDWRDFTSNWGDYYSQCVDDAYCLIDHNICEYKSQNGIDYWYSDGSVITNNRCNDNGQNTDTTWNGQWDRDGIDVSDHTHNTIVSYNECGNRASEKMDTITEVSVSGYYVKVAHIDRWYDIRYGRNVGFNGMGVRMGSVYGRINYLDIPNSKIYLRAQPTGVSVGNAIVGVNYQRQGIHIGLNSWDANDATYIGRVGNHYGRHNNVFNNTGIGIGTAYPSDPNVKTIPNTDITADGTGPIPALK